MRSPSSLAGGEFGPQGGPSLAITVLPGAKLAKHSRNKISGPRIKLDREQARLAVLLDPLMTTHQRERAVTAVRVCVTTLELVGMPPASFNVAEVKRQLRFCERGTYRATAEKWAVGKRVAGMGNLGARRTSCRIPLAHASFCLAHGDRIPWRLRDRASGFGAVDPAPVACSPLLKTSRSLEHRSKCGGRLPGPRTLHASSHRLCPKPLSRSASLWPP